MSVGLDPVVAGKLRQLSRRRFRLLAIRGLCAGIVVFLITFSLVALVDWYWLLTDRTRWALSGMAYLLVVVVVWVTSLRRLVRRPAASAMAEYVEQLEPDLRENLLSAIELATDDPTTVHDSPLFRSLLQGKVAGLMGSVRVPRLLPMRLISRWLLGAVALIAIATGLLTSEDSRFRQLATRAFLPGANVARVSRIHVQVLQPAPPSLTSAEDETVAVVVEVTGGTVNEVTLETFTKNQGLVRQLMYGRGQREFAANIHVADESVEYRILAGDAITERFRIDSRPRPRVTVFHKTYRYPDYAQLPEKTISEENGDLIALQGTVTRIAVKLDQRVSEAELRIDWADEEDLQTIPLAPVKADARAKATAAGGLWSAEVVVDRPGIYQVHLVSAATGFENIYAPKYEIRPQPDLIPRAGFVDQRETTLLVPPNDILALQAMAEDDLPLVRLEQGISVNGREWEMLPLETEIVSASEGRQVRAAWQWDLLKHQLREGDQVVTRLVATDRMGNKGESIPLRLIVASQDFDPNRHAMMEQKVSLYDDLAVFAALMNEQATSAREVVERVRQSGREDVPTALDRTTLRDLASRQQREAADLLEKIVTVERNMHPGADAYDLELTGRVIGRIRQEYASSPTYLLHVLQHEEDTGKLASYLDELMRSFERAADDAKNAAGHYQWLMTHNLLSALAADLESLLRQQRLIVDSPTQTWERLVRQETIVVNQLRVMERLIRDQRVRMPASIDQGLVNLLRWSEDQRLRLEDSMESQDKLDQLRQTSKELLVQFERQQRVDSLDGGLPSRMTGIRKDLENRSGSLYVPLDQMARAMQQENRLSAQADASQDSRESEKLRKESRRYEVEVELKQRPSFGQFRIRRQLTQSRRDPDAQYAADVGLTYRAVRSLLNQQSQVASAASPVPDHLLEIAPAYRTLEAGHCLILARNTLELLLSMERWESRSIGAHVDHPRQWDVVQQTLELASQRLREAGIDGKLVGRLDELRWSSPVRDANRKITERRWKRDLIVSAGHELVEIREALAIVVDDVQPAMDAARSIIAGYAPTIPEIARQTAQDVRHFEAETLAVADLAEGSETPALEGRLANLADRQQQVNQQIEDLFDALVEDADAQDILDERQLERARDADDGMSLVREPAARMNRALRQAQQTDQGEQQAQDLAQAAEHQEMTAQALDRVAEHYERLDQGLDVADSRAELRRSEPDQGNEQRLDQQYQDAERLSQLANQESPHLLEELEAELQRNPAMQQALSEIARNTLQDARNTLEFSAQEELNLQQANERSDTDYQTKKRELAEDLRELSGEASQLSNALVTQAHQAAGLGKTPEAQQRFAETRQTLHDAAAKAGAARDDQLLSDLVRAAEETRSSLRQATQFLRDAKEKTSRGKNEPIHADEKLREAARKDAELRRKQFFDQQQRVAREQVKRAEGAERRAEQNTANAEKQLRSVQQQLQEVRNKANARPDDNGLKQAVAQKQAQVAAEQQKVAVARQQQSESRQEAEAARVRSDELERKPTPPLDAANPATELADAYAEDAIKIAEQLNQRADQLVSQSQFSEQLQPSRGQLTSAQQQQSNITEDVAQTAADVARAGRHERRLDHTAVAQTLQQSADEIAKVAQNESTGAERDLSQAMGEAEQAEKAGAGNSLAPGNEKALKAQRSLSESEAALARQAQLLATVLEPLLAEDQAGTDQAPATGAAQQENAGNATEPPAGQGDQLPPGPSATGSPREQARVFTPREISRGRELARTLDELDRRRAASAADTDLATASDDGSESQAGPAQPARGPLESLAQAARARQAALAAARQQNQQQAMAAMTLAAAENNSASSDPATPSQFEVTDVNRDDDRDWGKLRDKSAEELTRSRSESVAEEYRKSVETYFRVLSERARSGKQ